MMYITRLEKEIKEGNEKRLVRLVRLLEHKAENMKPERKIALTPDVYQKRLQLSEACLKAVEVIHILYRRYHNKNLEIQDKD